MSVGRKDNRVPPTGVILRNLSLRAWPSITHTEASMSCRRRLTHGHTLTGVLAGVILVVWPLGVAAQAVDATEFGDPAPPVGRAMINQAGEGGATLRAVRVSEPLHIDGVIDEPFYQNTPPITEFIQSLPEENGEPSQLTEVWIGFDDQNVYVSAKVWDSAGPDGWTANEMRRDSQQLRENDNFGVFLDTFYDRRNAVGFYANGFYPVFADS